MEIDPAVFASIIVVIISGLSAYASQRAASRATRLNTDATNRTDMEKEAYERARKFDVETITRQDTNIDELREEIKVLRKEIDELKVKNRSLVSDIIRLEQELGYYPGYPKDYKEKTDE